MPAVRLSTNRRRRSSLAISYTAVKPGIYGINHRPVTFAPNITPVSYVEPEAGSSSSDSPESAAAFESLFPPSEAPAKPPTRRRIPPGKRPSKGYIPRPPNAFMLFRADFVKQKHVPGSIETNHGSLSKIIGNCWRSLPLEEKRVWEVKAKHAKAEHKIQYPEYRFKPVHNKNKDKKKDKPVTTIDDERRCEEVAQLLLEGKKGDELAAAVRNLDQHRHDMPPSAAAMYHRRSSSVPLPNDYYPHNFGFPPLAPGIALPSLPFFSQPHSLSRPPSPVSSISRQHQQRMMLGQRRASSVDPNLMMRSWDLAPLDSPRELQRDHSPLPEADTSLFDPAFLDGFSSFASSTSSFAPPSFPPEFAGGAPERGRAPAFSISDLLTTLPRHTADGTVSPHDLYPPTHLSQPSTAYSGSPPPLEASSVPVHAPQPQAPFGEMWSEFVGVGDVAAFQPEYQQQEQYQGQNHTHNEFDLGLGLDFAQPQAMIQQQPPQQQDGFCGQYGMDFGAPQVYQMDFQDYVQDGVLHQ